MTTRDRLRGLIAGLSAGAASGLFGVGGGLVLVPALSVIFGCTQPSLSQDHQLLFSIHGFALHF